MGSQDYLDAKSMQCGHMICSVCNRRISKGQYRLDNEGNEGSGSLAHRACCADDPQWSILDYENAAKEKRLQEYRAACRDFVAKWGVPEIEDFEDALAAGGAENV